MTKRGRFGASFQEKSMTHFFKRSGWFGNTDTKTSTSYYAYEGENATEIHQKAMTALLVRMRELADTVDSNGRVVFQFIYTNLNAVNPIVAFRFTSDWAYDRYHDYLLEAGSSLGRGVFDVWRSDPSAKYFFATYINQK